MIICFSKQRRMGQDLRSVVHYGVEVVRQVQSVPMFHLKVFCSSFKNQEMFHDLVCISLLKAMEVISCFQIAKEVSLNHSSTVAFNFNTWSFPGPEFADYFCLQVCRMCKDFAHCKCLSYRELPGMILCHCTVT